MKKHTFRYLKTVQQISCTTGPCSTPTADAYVTATEPSEAMFTSNSSRVFIIHSAHASPSMLIPQSRLRSQGPALAGCCDCLSPALALAGCLPALETMSARPSELLCLWYCAPAKGRQYQLNSFLEDEDRLLANLLWLAEEMILNIAIMNNIKYCYQNLPQIRLAASCLKLWALNTVLMMARW